MSDQNKETLNVVTLWLMRLSLPVIAFFVINYWNDFHEYRVEMNKEMKEIRKIMEEVRSSQRLNTYKIESLEARLDNFN